NELSSRRHPLPHVPRHVRSPDVVSYSTWGVPLDEPTSADPDTVSTRTRPAASPILTDPLTASARTSAALSTCTLPLTTSTSTSPYAPASLMLPLVDDASMLEPIGTPILTGPLQLPGQSTSTSNSSSSLDRSTPPPSHAALTCPVCDAVIWIGSSTVSTLRCTGPLTATGLGLA